MFAAVLNFIPFRMREIDASASTMLIGVMYTGYIMGIVTSLNSLRLIRIFRNEVNTMLAGLTFFYVVSGIICIPKHIYHVYRHVYILCRYVYDTYGGIRLYQ